LLSAWGQIQGDVSRVKQEPTKSTTQLQAEAPALNARDRTLTGVDIELRADARREIDQAKLAGLQANGFIAKDATDAQRGRAPAILACATQRATEERTSQRQQAIVHQIGQEAPTIVLDR